jgi:hypothetical protein
MKIKYNPSTLNCFFLTVLFSTLFFTADASTQERNVSITLGKVNEIVFQPQETTKKINLVFFSKARETSTLNLEIKAPGKTTITANTAGFRKAMSIENALKASSKINYIQELATPGGKFTKKLTIGSSQDTSSGPATMCNGYTLAEYRDYYEYTYLIENDNIPHRDDEELCTYFFGDAWRNYSGGGSNSSLSTLVAVSHVIKDACDKKSNYLVVMSLDLSKISASDRASGFTLSVQINESVYKGNKASSLKPLGDGKFKEALVLMSLMSGFDKHMYTRWSNGSVKRMSSTTTKNLAKITPWRSFTLGVSLPREQLRGGKMTVITFDLQSAYGVCFNARRTRQRYNGYPA